MANQPPSHLPAPRLPIPRMPHWALFQHHVLGKAPQIIHDTHPHHRLWPHRDGQGQGMALDAIKRADSEWWSSEDASECRDFIQHLMQHSQILGRIQKVVVMGLGSIHKPLQAASNSNSNPESDDHREAIQHVYRSSAQFVFVLKVAGTIRQHRSGEVKIVLADPDFDDDDIETLQHYGAEASRYVNGVEEQIDDNTALIMPGLPEDQVPSGVMNGRLTPPMILDTSTGLQRGSELLEMLRSRYKRQPTFSQSTLEEVYLGDDALDKRMQIYLDSIIAFQIWIARSATRES